MAKSIQGHVVVITGASSGVGRACARAFARAGARGVTLIARNEEALAVAAEEVRGAGSQALVCVADVADSAAVERAAAATEVRFGQIDTWVNCAMATVFAPVTRTTAEEYRRVTDVTYLGYVYGTQAALRRMLPRDEGTIVQVGSALAYRSIPLQSAYCAAKAAIRGFTDSLRTELIHEGSHVRVTAIHLPAVNTPQATRQRNKLDRQAQPVPPMFAPEVIADAIVWVAERAPRELLLGRPAWQAVIGERIAPWLLDHLAAKSWDAQMVDKPNDQAGDILCETLPGDPGAHGPYRDREHGPDWQMKLRLHPLATLAAAGAAGVAALGALALTRGR